MTKRNSWIVAATLFAGFLTLNSLSQSAVAEEPKPAVREETSSRVDETPSLTEPGQTSSSAAASDEPGVAEDSSDSPVVPLVAHVYDGIPQPIQTEEGVTAAAQAPILVNASSQLSFQALLTDGSGDPLPDGNVDLAFRIFRGATLVEGPIPVTAAVVNGVVDTLVPVSNSSFNGGSRQLSVTLVSPAAGELLPRIQLGAVPYAFRVDRVASEELDDAIELGSATSNGSLKVWDNSSDAVSIELNGDQSAISTYGSDGLEQIRHHGSTWGESIYHDINGNDVAAIVGASGFCLLGPCSDFGGRVQLNNADGLIRTLLSAPSGGGSLLLYNDAPSPVQTLRATGNAGDIDTLGAFNVRSGSITGFDTARLYDVTGGGRVEMHDETDRITFLAGSSGAAGGFLQIYQADGGLGMNVDGDATGSDGGGAITVYQADGSVGVLVDGDATNADGGGAISVRNAAGTEKVRIEGTEGTQGAGQILMRNSAGSVVIELDANWGGTDDGRVVASEVQITGGSDLSEQFDISADSGEVKPGMVVSIDPANAGKLMVSTKAYDRTVAGIVSGAGGVKTGMYMGQKGSEADGASAVALTGRVYAWCDASNGPIQPGDLLTTSNTPGHAMKVSDYGQSQGAIIGKAMTSLESGKGLVLVLVSLQ